MDAAALLDQIAALSPPFTADGVATATGAKLARDAQKSNPYFEVSSGAAAGFSSVEVRAPTAKSAGKGGIVVLDLAAPCVTRDAIGDRFGAAEPSVPTPPDPRMPSDSPEYDTYKQPWGALKLGFTPSSGCLASVVLDANG